MTIPVGLLWMKGDGHGNELVCRMMVVEAESVSQAYEFHKGGWNRQDPDGTFTHWLEATELVPENGSLIITTRIL